MAAALSDVPESLKQIQHYLKTAVEHDKRDPVVAYYCRLYAFQRALEIDKSSKEAKAFLGNVIGWLEETKKANSDEAIHNEVVGQAHMEHYALKLFLYADTEDRASRFGKHVVKSFYTAGMLFDVLTTFGELSEDIESNLKYAKWKAAYIHKCLKDGETPVPGPLNEDSGDLEGAVGGGATAPGSLGFEGVGQPTAGSSNALGPGTYAPPTTPSDPPGAAARPSQPQHQPYVPPPQQQPAQVPQWQPPANATGVQLNPALYQKAMKYCKFAGSALQYEDSSTAIDNLAKALNLLTTGHE